jgi:DNA-binding CsgD family transcriptional regulator
MGVPKTCCRCGGAFQDFSDRGLARTCTACKSPKPKPPRYSDAVLAGKPLTVREKQITQLVAEGKPSKVIAHEIHLGEGTIKMVISTILAKTGLANRTSLAVWWVVQKERVEMDDPNLAQPEDARAALRIARRKLICRWKPRMREDERSDCYWWPSRCVCAKYTVVFLLFTVYGFW